MNVKKLSPKLYRFLARLRMGLTSETIHIGTAGARYHINRHSYVERLIATGEFEKARAAFLCERLGPDDIFIDIGANIGFFSVLAVRLGAQVQAFEPEPNNFYRLQRNIKLNGFNPDQIAVFNCALGNTSGEVCLNRPLSDNYGRATIGFMEAADAVKVPLQRLDTMLKPNKTRYVVKIDVEGAELQVLEGADSLMDKMKTGSLWLVEVHTGCGVKASAVAEKFLHHGYGVSYFDDAIGRIVPDAPKGQDVMVVAERR